ncbi:MAG: hypothetical protein U0Z44_16760 [Kouleothrix sp.]
MPSAIAAGVAHALMPGADVFSVVRACLERAAGRGARHPRGPARCRGRISRGGSSWRSKALRASDLLDTIRRIEASVGNSVMMVRSAPAAVGVFVAAGNVLDTVAAAPALATTAIPSRRWPARSRARLRGIGGVPADMFATVKAVANDEDIEAIGAGLTAIAWRNLGGA